MMVLAEIASIITIANFSSKLISRLRKKKKKRKTVPRQHKQTKEEEMIKKLLTNPTQAVKEMGAEYVVKNRKRIIRNIEERVVEEFSG